MTSRAQWALVVGFSWLGAAGCGGEPGNVNPGSGGDAASTSNSSASATASTTASGPEPDACGDGTCDHELGEDCTRCEADCGACAVCGDGQCERSSEGESCESCEEDCGACSSCGDSTCDADSGETCATCVDDCGECETCGDGACDDDETCASCPGDCGACDPCGDGKCEAAKGETCSSCDEDCGECNPCGNGTCEAGKGENCTKCPKDCGSCERKGCVQGEFKPFHGGFHAHTKVSTDAKGSQSEAFNHARNVTKPALDFMWLTEHRDPVSQSEWTNCLAVAKKFTKDGTFVAGCGFEKTIIENDSPRSLMHVNTLFPPGTKLLPRDVQLTKSFQQLGDCVPCVGQFNHPSVPDAGDSHGWKLFPAARPAMRLFELSGVNKKAPNDQFPYARRSFTTALDNGWWVSPAMNEDNHDKGWGDSKKATVVWATALTRTAIQNSVRANRTTATNDDTSTVKMIADGACWMGSRLEGKGKTTLAVTAADKQKPDVFDQVTFWGPNNKQLATRDCKNKNPCTVSYGFTVTKKTWVFAVARQKDGDFNVSAPIWFTP